MGKKPEFTERDDLNDPQFSRVFNEKPGDSLLFQTTPILIGNLIQSSCIQCHKQSSAALQGLADTAGSLTAKRMKKINAVKEGYKNEKEALLSLIALKKLIYKEGLAKTIKNIKEQEEDQRLLPKKRDHLEQQILFLEKESSQNMTIRQKNILENINAQLVSMLGTQSLVNAFEKKITEYSSSQQLEKLLSEEQQSDQAIGSLFDKLKAIELERALLTHVEETQDSLTYVANDEDVISAMTSDIDWMTLNYRRGQQLYLSQACYACHRISGLARGGVGPDLTQAGNSYPWYLKESIVWPQADLKTSTMPNFGLDHVEIEDLMTFLLGQKGPTRSVSQTEYKLAVQEWEAGRKMAWEKAIPLLKSMICVME